jgi:hypothetical protein
VTAKDTSGNGVMLFTCVQERKPVEVARR